MKYDIVILSGGFDPPHVGHVRMIQDAATKGRKVIVGVNSDNWLMRKKGYIFMPWTERVEMIQAIKGVGEAVGFNDDDNSADDVILKVRERFPKANVAFANGGDRKDGNTPEAQACFFARVDMLWGIGGEEKAQSSSTLVENAKQD